MNDIITRRTLAKQTCHDTSFALALVSCVLVESCGSLDARGGPDVEPASRPAAQLVGAMVERYGAARSYQDTGEGTATMRIDTTAQPFRAQFAFATAFDRPTGRFRFTYAEAGSPVQSLRVAIWSTGGAIHVWNSNEPATWETTDLESAIEAVAGVSRSKSRNIPSMLLGATTKASFRETQFVFDGKEDVHGVSCLRISESTEDRSTVLWIGDEDHLLRRVSTTRRVDVAASASGIAGATVSARPRSVVVEELTEYHPLVDRPIAQDVFDFRPPVP